MKPSIRLPVIGGRHDGAYALVPHITPAAVVKLGREDYKIKLIGRKPALVPA